MKYPYLSYLFDVEKYVSRKKKYILDCYFDGGKSNVSYTRYIVRGVDYNEFIEELQNLVKVIKLLDVFAGEVEVTLGFFKDSGNIAKQRLEKNFDHILNSLRNIQKDLKNKISMLSNEEIFRLDEALHCYFENCYYASIVMSVSTIEDRLGKLLKLKNPKLKVRKMTLGHLIGEYLDNKEKYGNIIPQIHEPLLELCNTYRIYSAHPKKEIMNANQTNAILSLVFNFLLDRKIYKKIESSK